jgi:hypothetical protein
MKTYRLEITRPGSTRPAIVWVEAATTAQAEEQAHEMYPGCQVHLTRDEQGKPVTR